MVSVLMVLAIFELTQLISSKRSGAFNTFAHEMVSHWCWYTPLLILMHDVIILTQSEATGALPPSLAVAAPIASF